ncbi:WD repeat-containing protein wrap73 [Boothiomyces macroporosus]|uniref:Peroxidase n=1 Tax=Boothiomyces macroporosus TaxID=261099 RepID=A0AAD5UK52_9FUNG|nr:WD repeat-containing protein wrap73 [Boothiomyces macroporosus]
MADFTEIFKQTDRLCRFSPNGEYIATAVQQRLVVREAHSLQILSLFNCNDLIQEVQWAKDSDLLLVGSYKQAKFQIWSLHDEKWTANVEEGIVGCVKLIWAPDARHVLSFSDYQVYSVNIVTDNGMVTDYKKVGRFPTESCDLEDLRWSPDGRFIAVWTSLSQYHVYLYYPDGRLVADYSAYDYGLGIKAATWSPSSQILAVGSFDEKCRLLNHYSWKPLIELSHEKQVAEKNIPCYKEIDLVQVNGNTRSWASNVKPKLSYEVKKTPCSVPTINVDPEKPNPKVGISTIAFNCTGNLLLTRNEKQPNALWIWDMINLKQMALIQQTQPIKAVAWNPLVKERLAFCCASGLLYLWEYGLGCDAIEVPAVDRPASKLSTEATIIPYQSGLKEFLIGLFKGTRLDVKMVFLSDSVHLTIHGPSLVLPTALPYLQGRIAYEFEGVVMDWSELNLVGAAELFDGIMVESNIVQDLSELIDNKLQGMPASGKFKSLDEFYMELQNHDLSNEDIIEIRRCFNKNKIKLGHLAKLDRGFLKDCGLPKMQLTQLLVIYSVYAACPFAGEHKVAKRSANWQVNYKNTLDNAEWDQIKAEIQPIINQGFGPLLVRLSWHDAGTYDAASNTGGPHATMRFAPVANYEANNGLGSARNMLAPIKSRHPGISYADLWSFAGAVAVSNIGGPTIQWRPGRNDAVDSSDSLTPDGRLPDADLGAAHLRSIFYRMGFGDREIVALSGGHNLGATHLGNSGYDGLWTSNPGSFGNEFFTRLNNDFFSNYQTETLSSGKTQYHDSSNKMMLPTDVSLIQDPSFTGFVQTYASDKNAFYGDFKAAFQRLQELGVGGGLGSPVETRFGVPTTGHDNTPNPPPVPTKPQTTQGTVASTAALPKTTKDATSTTSAAVPAASSSISASVSAGETAAPATGTTKPTPNSAVKSFSLVGLVISLFLL